MDGSVGRGRELGSDSGALEGHRIVAGLSYLGLVGEGRGICLGIGLQGPCSGHEQYVAVAVRPSARALEVSVAEAEDGLVLVFIGVDSALARVGVRAGSNHAVGHQRPWDHVTRAVGAD